MEHETKRRSENAAVREMRVQVVGKPPERPVAARPVRTFAKTRPLYVMPPSVPGQQQENREAISSGFRTVIVDERDVQSREVVTVLARPARARAQQRTDMHKSLAIETRRVDRAEDWRSWRAEDAKQVNSSGTSYRWPVAISLWVASLYILCVLAVTWLNP